MLVHLVDRPSLLSTAGDTTLASLSIFIGGTQTCVGVHLLRGLRMITTVHKEQG
jgi:hypothetical protein